MIKRRNLPLGISTTDDGHLIFRAPESPVSGDDLRVGELSFSLDSANSQLAVRTKLPGGALVCALLCYGAV